MARNNLRRAFGHWVHDIGRLWWLAVAGYFLGLVALVAFVQSVRKQLPWVLLAAVVILLVVSFVAYSRELSRRLTATPEHIDRFRLVAQNLFDDIQHRRPLRYSDGTPYAGGTLREIWRSHVPSLAEKLDAYEAAGPALIAAEKALRYRMNTEVQSLDQSAGWDKENTIRLAGDYTNRITRLDAGRSNDPGLSLTLRHVDARDGRMFSVILGEVAGPKLSGSVGGCAVWEGPSESMPATDPFRAVFAAIRASSEWQGAREAGDAVLATRYEAEDALEEILGKDGFPGECTDVCRQSEP